MLWSELWDASHEPSTNQVKEFVATPLWDDLADYLQQAYKVEPTLFYSCCSMQKGFWKGCNMKYKNILCDVKSLIELRVKPNRKK